MPVDEIKIDRSFVLGLTQQHGRRVDRALDDRPRPRPRASTSSPRASRTSRRCDRLAELGCDQAQGYYFSRPLVLDALLAWFEQPVLDAEPPEPVQA